MGRRKGRDMKTITRVVIVAAGCLSLLLAAGCSEGRTEATEDHLQKGREAYEAERYTEAI